jgi:hypothetical protein
MRILCDVCHQERCLQKLVNYYGVKHYNSELKAKGIFPFHHHQQTKAHAETQLKNIKAENFNNSKMSNCIEHKFGSVQGVQAKSLK